MLAGAWNIVLTALFACTALVCIGALADHRLVAHLRGSRTRDDHRLSDDDVVHIGHAVMSIAMVAMTWWMQSDVLLWAQVALFAVLGAALLPGLARARDVRGRVDAVSHLVLHAAMAWMLAAMPLLMAGAMDHGGGAHEGHEGHGSSGAMLMQAPLWASIVNWSWVGVSGVVAVWWLWRLLTSARHRVHALSHLAMALGMTAMLVLMTG